ncbi:MAG: YgiQ family radical SAM protein [Candidatus Tenebribacter davisii]|nr:YgiQ family radical SAM protein [Candidatus Tenebribacter davisii]
MNNYLPISKNDLKERGWDQLDIIIITGDAYVDHPSFGPVIVARSLEAEGYKVGIISQPDWQNDKDFKKLGRPRLFFGVSSGNMDSMINHYTAMRKIRSEDAYSPGGKSGLRPNRAAVVYTQKVRSIFKGTPVILGGVEASMRRLPHYDYWSDNLRNSIIFDSRADLLVYGMGERTINTIAKRLADGEEIKELKNIRGTVVIGKEIDDAVILPEFSSDLSKKDFHEMRLKFWENFRDKVLIQKFGKSFLIHNPPAKPLTTKELDKVYDLEFTRQPHPTYNGKKIPAFTQIKDSVTAHRGCFGGCHFCAIGSHQGKTIRSRSIDSIRKEIMTIASDKNFNGTISDIGGPSANMYGMSCKLGISETCKRTSCLFPEICPHLNSSHLEQKKLLNEVRKLKNIKHSFISSGLRFDLALKDIDYIKVVAKYHTSGLLKLAPEHISPEVLKYMYKPSVDLYERFHEIYSSYCEKIGKKQFIIPYIIVGHPGSSLKETIKLAVYLKKKGIKLKQIQQFTPTPMTQSTMMYYTGFNLDGNNIHIPRGREVRLQKALVQWFVPQNKKLIIEALKNAGRKDLIDFFLDNPRPIKPNIRKRKR